MITRAFLTLVIGELPDSTDRRLSHRDRGIGQVPLHYRPDPPRHLVRARRRQRLDPDDVAKHGDADELAGSQRRSKLGPVELDRGGDAPKDLSTDELAQGGCGVLAAHDRSDQSEHGRSEEHTSELQSQSNLVCRLLLEKKHRTALPNTARYPTFGPIARPATPCERLR